MSLLHRRHKDDQHDLHSVVSPTATAEQTSQQQTTSRVPRRRSSGLKFFASSSVPKHEPSKGSHKAWETEYLMDLRANRPMRPGGSRPLPERIVASTQEPYARASSAMSCRPSTLTREAEATTGTVQERCTSALSHHPKVSQLPGTSGGGGRPMVRQPSAAIIPRDFSTSSISSGMYRESGMRWMEKQEARSLREALEDMDMQDEAKLHTAAQDEASELVWKHKNKIVPSRKYEQTYNYKQHLEKGAHARSQSIGWHATPVKSSSDHASTQQHMSSRSASSNSDMSSSLADRNTTVTFKEPMRTSREPDVGHEHGHALWDSPQKKAYMNLTSPKLPLKTSGRRRSSRPRARDVSGGLFRNPNDKIYEEPDASQKPPNSGISEQSRIPAPLTTKTRNVVSGMATASQPSLRSRTTSSEDKPGPFRSEIQRNPPSQSRNPAYLKNENIPALLYGPETIGTEAFPETSQLKDGREIRGDDIKAATSMRMKDRSQKLPSPSAVSNRPGRPIVSFDKDWKPKEPEKDANSSPFRPSGVPSRMRSKAPLLEKTASAPIVPTINVPDPPSIEISGAPPNATSSVPSISISDNPLPIISLPDDPPTSRPLPSPSSRPRPSPANRPLPHHSSTTPVHSSKLYWSPSSRRATAQCAACALPIEGRIVSAASQRFHPHCFTCYHCATALECVAFYPEPDQTRNARLTRIEARAHGSSVPEEEEKSGETALDDGDSSLRFYCHLDFHELFSPRCRSCKTPIETEVVLACGASWHVGHFFCAQCGDPFDSKTPFVEKDGYAWCVGCHAGRFSGKCKGCKRPVVDGGVMALEGEWHVECFCCVECGGQFEDGRFFTRGQEEKPVCVGCEERRLKA